MHRYSNLQARGETVKPGLITLASDEPLLELAKSISQLLVSQSRVPIQVRHAKSLANVSSTESSNSLNPYNILLIAEYPTIAHTAHQKIYAPMYKYVSPSNMIIRYSKSDSRGFDLVILVDSPPLHRSEYASLIQAQLNYRPRPAPPLSLHFDTAEFSDEEITEILGNLSDLYCELGGDALIINRTETLDPANVLTPEEA